MPGNQRRLLVALVPVLFLLVLTAGMRLLSRAADGADSPHSVPRDGNGRPAPRPTPLPPPEPSVPADPATQKALVAVVSGQMACFARGDYRAAMDFAEPRFREAWTAEAFRDLVTGGYYPLTLRLPATFGPGSTSGTNATLPVRLVSDDGETVRYDYSLANSAGKWYVVGVSPVVVPPPASRAPGSREKGGGGV